MNIIPAENYHDIFLAIVTLCFIPIYFKYMHANGDLMPTNQTNSQVPALVLCVFIILFIGLRPISEVFRDMTQYQGIYNRWRGQFFWDWSVNNIIYDNLMMYLASMKFSPTLFYLGISIIYFSGMYVVCKKFFHNHLYATFCVFLSAFSTFAAGTNGIKAGVAASVFLMALAYCNNLKICIPLLIVSFGLHHSMELLVVVFAITMLYQKPSFYFMFWIISLILSILHITYFQTLFAGFTDEHGASYLLTIDSDWNSGRIQGFRYDFVLYSAMPILMGWYAIKKRKIEDKLYNIILSTYIFTNAIWLLCMYASYTNRIAYLSWFMYPIVLVYPCLLPQFGEDRYRVFAKVAGLHLGFTLFMHIIYY